MKDWKGRHTAIVVAFCYVMYEWVMFAVGTIAPCRYYKGQLLNMEELFAIWVGSE